MPVRALTSSSTGGTKVIDPAELASATPERWIWVDLDSAEKEILAELGESLKLDPTATYDAAEDVDLAKFDDFGHHLLIVLHGISASDGGELSTYEVDCFITDSALVTVRSGPSRSIDRLWEELQRSDELAAGGPDEMVAKLADVMLRRWVSVVSAVDVTVDDIVERALDAEPEVLREITLLRSELGRLRRMARHHSAVAAELAKSSSNLVTDSGRRRFADAYDVARRVDHDLESVRSELREALDAYNGAEARMATNVSRVLTIYAAVMLPLTLIVGFFGMNFPNMPGLDTRLGWELTVVGMVVLTMGSLAVFGSVGWIRLPSAKHSTRAVVKILSEASRAPTQIVGSLYTRTEPGARRRRPNLKSQRKQSNP